MFRFISPKCDVDFRRDQSEDIFNLKPKTTTTFGITKLGQLAALFNGLSPEQIKLILSSYMWGCSALDMIAIAAYLMIRPSDFKSSMTADIKWVDIYRSGLPFYLTNGRKGTSDDNVVYRTRLIIADDFIDGLVLFTAIEKLYLRKVGWTPLKDGAKINAIIQNMFGFSGGS